MASLTHVCQWNNGHWQRVTAEEAAKIHSEGTVSAHSKLFMCELCGQYVILTNGFIRDRYFKHSAYEVSKNCPDRTFGIPIPTYQAGEHNLPIRLTVVSDKSFNLEIGFIPLPEEVLNKQIGKSLRIYTPSFTANRNVFTYLFERFTRNKTTYLSVGDIPAEEYKIEYDDNLQFYYPRKVKGVEEEGCIFDEETGKKLSEDADVQIHKKYLLLTTRRIGNRYANVKIEKLCEKREGFKNWLVYRIEAIGLEEDAAKFFLNYHCRLTDKPMTMCPVWPIYESTPYYVKHTGNNVFIHLNGQSGVNAKVFPEADTVSTMCVCGQVIRINCNDRQQLISAGRYKVLQYLYLMVDSLNSERPVPDIVVKDIKGKALTSGIEDKLPYKKTIRVLAPFDGKVIISKDNFVIDKIEIKAETPLDISNLSYGYKVDILQGLDNVWSVSYCRVEKNQRKDSDIYNKLIKFGGPMVAINHNIGAIIKALGSCPQAQKWLYVKIREGMMPRSALNYLKKIISKKEY